MSPEAADVIKMIETDIAAGVLPADKRALRTFGDMHDYTDPNMYLLQAMQFTTFEVSEMRRANMVIDEVNAWLAERSA